jgi:hypothetical protein
MAQTSQRARMIPTDLLAISSDVTADSWQQETREKLKGSAKPHIYYE